MHVVASSENALHVESKSCLYEFTEMNFLSVGSQLPPRTLIYSLIVEGHPVLVILPCGALTWLEVMADPAGRVGGVVGLLQDR